MLSNADGRENPLLAYAVVVFDFFSNFADEERAQMLQGAFGEGGGAGGGDG